MVTLTFTGTPSEIHAEMKEMLNHISASVGTEAILAANKIPTHVGVDPAIPGADKTVVTAAPTPEKKTRTRRTKEQMAEARAQEPIETKQHDTRAEVDERPAALQMNDEAAKPATPAVVNKEAVHAALQQVNVAVGLPKAREILTHFKVNRMSELKPEDYKPFIEKCNEAVMMA